MRKHSNQFIAILIIAVMILTGCSSQNNTQQGTTDNSPNTSASTSSSTTASSTDNTTSQIIVSKDFTANDLDVGYEESTATNITLNGSQISIDGDGATAKDSVLTISKKGTYVLTGTLTDGQIVVDVKDTDKVQLVLNGASITNSDNAAIYIKSADKAFITLKAGTVNNLSDGKNYVQTDDKNVDGVIFSSADLTFNGTGTLTVTGNYKHGITSKDDLVITGGTYNITAVKDDLNGKDCVKIKDGTFTLSSTNGNGIVSKNKDDATKGFVYIAGGKITVTKCQEGIEGTAIVIDDGIINITSQDDGINGSNGISSTNNGGAQNGDSNVDINSNNADVRVNQLSTNATSSNNTSAITTLNSTTNSTINTTDATSSATVKADPNSVPGDLPDASGDGSTSDPFTNGTTDGSTTTRPGRQGHVPGQGGFGKGGFGGGGGMENDPNVSVTINGGTINVDALGDGLDSNGSLTVNGGTINVSGPTENNNGALDYNGTAIITGGTITVAGSAGMAQGFSDTSSQYSLLYNLSSMVAAGTEVTLTDEDGKVVVSYTPKKEYQSVVISTPSLTKDETYTLTCGDQTAQITLSSVVTSNGQQGMGDRGGFFQK